jgi:hypothetical protein
VSYLQSLSRCATGTCYAEIGGPLLDRALEHHGEALTLMDQPMGRTLGAWLWSEIGIGALAAGDAPGARGLLERALGEPTAVMHLMRPLALEGLVAVALVGERVEEARAHLDECERYVHERQMLDHLPQLALLGGRVAAAEGRHLTAMDRFDEAITIASESGMRRVELEARAGRALSLDGLDRADDASSERVAARRLMEEIASGFRDDELRGGFVAGASALLER